MVVTTQPASAVLPRIRDAFLAVLGARGDLSRAEMTARARAGLEGVMVSHVFDLDGLWELLGELACPPLTPIPESLPSSMPAEPKTTRQELGEQKRDEVGDDVRVVQPGPADGKPVRTEIADSEDEDDYSPLDESPPPLSQLRATIAQERLSTAAAAPDRLAPIRDKKTPPDLILIANFSALLSDLFARREKTAAHETVQLLAGHLRHLSRTLPSQPLILLTNGTTSTADEGQGSKGVAAAAGPISPWTPVRDHARPGTGARPSRPQRPLDPTLRSVFNPAPLPVPGYAYGAAARRNKPTFGLVFTQLLDVHLLCTRVTRRREDAVGAAAAYHTPGRSSPTGYASGAVPAPGPVQLVWVVECLLDEMGVLPDAPGGKRRFREQRWCAVDVRDGLVVDAFDPRAREVGEVRVAGGFGGLRV